MTDTGFWSGCLAGGMLGWAHWRMFLWNVRSLVPQADRLTRLRIFAVLGTGLRMAVTAGVGFALVYSGRVPARGLVAGLLISVIVFRFWALRQARKGKA